MVLLEGMLVQMIPVAVSANHKSATVEVLHAQRKNMHLSTADFVCLEVSRDLDALAHSPDLLQRLKQDPEAIEQVAQMECADTEAGFKELGSELVAGCKEEFKTFVESQKFEGEVYYNSDDQYLRAVTDLLERRATALAKIRLYLENPRMFSFQISIMSLMVRRPVCVEHLDRR